ncbi:MAG: hypothetical protein LBG97_07995 [Coriobacteriales bacterium]|jgi:hypothetical protein|nr:hypothetical protein [Coriobacteriales bacterium]
MTFDISKYKQAWVMYRDEVVLKDDIKINDLHEERLIEARLTNGTEELHIWRDDNNKLACKYNSINCYGSEKNNNAQNSAGYESSGDAKSSGDAQSSATGATRNNVEKNATSESCDGSCNESDNESDSESDSESYKEPMAIARNFKLRQDFGKTIKLVDNINFDDDGQAYADYTAFAGFKR